MDNKVGTRRRAYVIDGTRIEHHNSLDDMKHILKELEKFNKSNELSLTVADALGSSPEGLGLNQQLRHQQLSEVTSVIDPILPVLGTPAILNVILNENYA